MKFNYLFLIYLIFNLYHLQSADMLKTKDDIINEFNDLKKSAVEMMGIALNGQLTQEDQERFYLRAISVIDGARNIEFGLSETIKQDLVIAKILSLEKKYKPDN